MPLSQKAARSCLSLPRHDCQGQCSSSTCHFLQEKLHHPDSRCCESQQIDCGNIQWCEPCTVLLPLHDVLVVVVGDLASTVDVIGAAAAVQCAAAACLIRYNCAETGAQSVCMCRSARAGTRLPSVQHRGISMVYFNASQPLARLPECQEN